MFILGSLMATRKHILHSVHHFLAGALLILKGITKFGQEKPAVATLFILFGIIILVYFIYVLAKRSELRGLNITIHVLEGIAALFTAYIFYVEGATYLPYLFLLAALGFFISAYVTITRKERLKAPGI